MSNFVITTYPSLYRRYIILDVKDEEEAWSKYFEELPDPYDEEGMEDTEPSVCEEITEKLKIEYHLSGGGL